MAEAGVAERVTLRDASQIACLCLLWYVVSSGNGVIVKAILNDFPYPMTVTMVQLLSITVYSGPIFSFLGVRRSVSMKWDYYMKLIVPLAFGKFLASVSSHVSIWKVPVSYAHTVKATTPLFVVVLSRVILGEKQTLKVYLSLIPIIVGVFIATITELSFDVIGLISALLSTLVFSLQNIFSKKVLADTNIHHLRLLFLLARLSLLFFIPVWLLVDFRKFWVDESLLKNTDIIMLLFLLFLDGTCNFAQNVIAFNMLYLVSSLTYAVCNASKRIFIIAVSLAIIGNPVTPYNVLGMSIAILGVLCYNKAKYDSIQAKQREKLLPFSVKDSKRNTYSNSTQPNFLYKMVSQRTGSVGSLTYNGIANGTSRNSLKGQLLDV